MSDVTPVEPFNPNPHPPAGSVSHNMPGGGAPPAGGVDWEKEARDTREEAAGYRTKYAPYRDAFEPYTEEERAEWLDLARTLANDPQAGAARFREIAESISPTIPAGPPVVELPTPAASEPQGTPAEDQPLTRGEFLRLREAERQAELEYQQKTSLERQVETIYDEAGHLGYQTGTQEMVDLLWLAQNQTSGDLQKAHQMMQAREEEIVNRYLERRQAANGGVPIPVRGGQVPGGGQEPKDFNQARASLEARLNATAGN